MTKSTNSVSPIIKQGQNTSESHTSKNSASSVANKDRVCDDVIGTSYSETTNQRIRRHLITSKEPVIPEKNKQTTTKQKQQQNQI